MEIINIQDIKTRIIKIDNVRAFLSNDARSGVVKAGNVLRDHSFILGLEKIESYYLLIDLFINESDLVLKQEKYVDKPYNFYEIKAITNKNKKISIIFIEINNLLEYINSLSRYTVIVDKDKILRSINKNRGDEIKPGHISTEEFKTQGIDFFLNLIDVAASLSRGDLIAANYLYDRSKLGLLSLVRLFVAQKYDFKVFVGQNGEDVKMHLNEEFYKMYLEIFNTNKSDSFWSSIFNIANLYRKIGLETARALNYDYPKKEDVDSMNYLRFLYDGFGRN